MYDDGTNTRQTGREYHVITISSFFKAGTWKLVMCIHTFLVFSCLLPFFIVWGRIQVTGPPQSKFTCISPARDRTLCAPLFSTASAATQTREPHTIHTLTLLRITPSTLSTSVSGRTMDDSCDCALVFVWKVTYTVIPFETQRAATAEYIYIYTYIRVYVSEH